MARRNPASRRERPCVFCAIAEGRAPASVIDADDELVAFLDIYPMRPGHALVVPRQHAMRVADVSAEVRARLWQRATEIATALRASALPCVDVNLVLNDGPAANQTVPHVHVHVIPRTGRDLPALLRMLAQRPVQAMLGGPPRAELDRVAAEIARHL